MVIDYTINRINKSTIQQTLFIISANAPLARFCKACRSLIEKFLLTNSSEKEEDYLPHLSSANASVSEGGDPSALIKLTESINKHEFRDYLPTVGDPSKLRFENRKLVLINSSELDLTYEFSIYS